MAILENIGWMARRAKNPNLLDLTARSRNETSSRFVLENSWGNFGGFDIPTRFLFCSFHNLFIPTTISRQTNAVVVYAETRWYSIRIPMTQAPFLAFNFFASSTPLAISAFHSSGRFSVYHTTIWSNISFCLSLHLRHCVAITSGKKSVEG